MSGDSGKLVLRVVLGALILLHGIAKLRGGIDFVTHSVTAAGLPATLAYAVYAGEVLAPLAVIAGWHARIGAAVIAIHMAFALGRVQPGQPLSAQQAGGRALELRGL
mgnify:CR=1 FL=1